MNTLHAVGNWIYHFFGFSGTGSHYGFWSGSGSDLGEVAILGAVVGAYRKIGCHEPHCLRIGHHTTAEGHKLCRKHIQKPRSELNLVEVHEDHL